MLIKTQINAGARLEFYEPGDFFRLLDASFPITVTYFTNGQEVARAEGVGAGYAEKFERIAYDRYTITSTFEQEIQFASRFGNSIQYDAPPTGDVNVLNVRGQFTQAAKTVTSTSGQLAAQNLLRNYLLIQNNSTTGDIYINVAGAAATVSGGIKIAANGGSYELTGYVPTGQVSAIGTIASNSNIIVLEG